LRSAAAIQGRTSLLWVFVKKYQGVRLVPFIPSCSCPLARAPGGSIMSAMPRGRSLPSRDSQNLLMMMMSHDYDCCKVLCADIFVRDCCKVLCLLFC
jgi:hypothetical protein